MRTLVSSLCGIVVALICIVALLAVTSLGPVELSICGALIAIVAGYSVHGTASMRRTCMRLSLTVGRIRAHLRSDRWHSIGALRASLRSTRRPRATEAARAPSRHVHESPVETASVATPPSTGVLAQVSSIAAFGMPAAAADADHDHPIPFAPLDATAAATLLVASTTADLVLTGADGTRPVEARKRVRRDPCQGQVGRCNRVLEQFLARGTNREF